MREKTGEVKVRRTGSDRKRVEGRESRVEE